MEAKVIYAPFIFPFSPYLSVPILTGQLQKAGFQASCYDINADFHSHVYNKEFLKSSIQKATDIINSDKYKNLSVNMDDFEKELSIEEKISYFKKIMIENILADKEYINYVVENVEKAVKILQSDECYNFKKFIEAQNILKDAIDIAFLPYSPSVSRILKNPIFSHTYKDIKYQALTEDINPYFDFYRERIKQGAFDNTNIAFILIAHPNQFIPSLTLGKLLKEKNIKVSI